MAQLRYILVIREIRTEAARLLRQHALRVCTALRRRCQTDASPHDVERVDRLMEGAAHVLDRFWLATVDGLGDVYLRLRHLEDEQ